MARETAERAQNLSYLHDDMTGICGGLRRAFEPLLVDEYSLELVLPDPVEGLKE